MDEDENKDNIDEEDISCMLDKNEQIYKDN